MMTMKYELITPAKAAILLKKNGNNRSIKKTSVKAYANDMKAGNWSEDVATPIAIDDEGVLRDGQHRLNAIIESGVAVKMWVCRGVASDGLYDGGITRSIPDQISISRPDLDCSYHSNRYVAFARYFITKASGDGRRKVTANEIIDFTDNHKETLDAFFSYVPLKHVAKLTMASTYVALFTAYCDGIDLTEIAKFFEILCSGMSTSEKEFPIIAFRNYLTNIEGYISTTDDQIKRCQFALKKYLSGSCTKKNIQPKDFVYPIPYMEDAA